MDVVKKILSGKLFIYPTDTIYGLGCNALDVPAVQKLKDLKRRDKNKPLSVIAPSIKWIEENLIVDVDLSKYLPGQYTLILRKKKRNFLNHVAKGDTLGVRIPNCDFFKSIQLAKVPFITTSVNLSGESFAVSTSLIDEFIKSQVDEIIDGGVLNGRPSTLIFNGKEIKR